jgi:hypothetical protein
MTSIPGRSEYIPERVKVKYRAASMIISSTGRIFLV